MSANSAWLAANRVTRSRLRPRQAAARWRVLVQPDVTYNNGDSSITGTALSSLVDVSSVYHTIGQVTDLDLLVSALLLLVLAVVGIRRGTR